jgi:hypothetical protein
MLTALSLAFLVPSSMAVPSKVTVHGANGQTLSSSKAKKLISGEKVTVSGRNYDTNIGIYVAFCEVPAKGVRPSKCYGGINLTGNLPGSVWISSNVPWYEAAAAKIAKPYGKHGTFKVKLTVAQKFDSTDCKVVRCAIVTRADHNNSKNRTADVVMPVTFK